MNLKNLLLILLLVTPLQAAQRAPGITVAGMQVTPDDMIKLITASIESIEKSSQETRTKKNQAIALLEKQLVDLGKRKDQGRVGDGEFEQAKNMLQGKIDQLRHELTEHDKAGYAMGSNIQTVVMDGWKTLLKNYEEEQQRKTQIAIAAASKAVENQGKLEQTKLELDGAMERLKFASRPENLKTYGIFLAGTTAGVVGGYYGVKLAARYIEQKIEKIPALAFETSYQGWIYQKLAPIYAWFGSAEPAPALAENIVFAPELEQQLTTIAEKTRMVNEKGLPHQSLMLYGPPGTGKTWFATLLARMSDMDYVITSADRFSQFAEGHDVQELHALLDWATNSSRGMIIFVDEIDALGRHRDKLDERWIRLQEAFLARTGASSTKFKIVGATNRLQALDPAFLSRFPIQIQVPLPGVSERARLIDLYLKKYIALDKRSIKQDGAWVEAQLAVAPEITPDVVGAAAQQTEGFSGRKIEQMVDDMRARCYLTNLILTKEIFNSTVNDFVKQYQQAAQAA